MVQASHIPPPASQAFIDRRPQALAQRRLNDLADASHQGSRQYRLATAANRGNSSSAPVQGYFVHKPTAVADGTTFESQDIRRSTHAAAYEKTTATFSAARQAGDEAANPLDSVTTRHHDGATARAWNAVPDMNISDGRKLAISTQGQAKEFFAMPGMAARSNEILASRRGSMRLKEEGGGLHIPGNATELKRIVPASDVPGLHGQAATLQKIDSLASHLCNEVVHTILGSSQRVVVLAQPGPLVEDRTLIRFAMREPAAKIGGYMANTETEDIDRKQVGAHPVNGQAASDYKDLADVDKSARAKKLGVNEHAAPQVGEAFVTRTLGTPDLEGNMDSTLDLEQYQAALTALNDADRSVDVAKQQTDAKIQAMRNIWGEHYAGVVATDGGDSITLENYNRRAEHAWELARIFNNLFSGFEEFRNFVATQVQSLPLGIETEESSRLIQAAMANANIMGEELGEQYRQAIAAANHTVTTSLVQDEDHARTMLHFQMYGKQAGQSFHEKFAGTTYNAVTTRIESSASEARERKRLELKNQATHLCTNIALHTQISDAQLLKSADFVIGKINDQYAGYDNALASIGTNADLAEVNAWISDDLDADKLTPWLFELYAGFYFALTGARPKQRDKESLQAVVDQIVNTKPTPGMRQLQALMQDT